MGQEINEKEIWVDNVKLIACVLVVMGHFFRSMISVGVVPEQGFCQWFDETVYFFHVPLFFVCSGYLYQKRSRVEDLASWRKNVAKKALNLGIPYLIFSFGVWLLKTVFSDSVNERIGGLFYTLFLYPDTPYWYLYCLFFLFLVIPTFKNKRNAYIGLAIAAVFKFLEMAGRREVLILIFSFGIWFVSGMLMSVADVRTRIKEKGSAATGIAAGILFLLLSVLLYRNGIASRFISAGMCVLGCSAVILPAIIYSDTPRPRNRVFAFLSQYTMPLYLMHVFFAAPVRVVLLKLGITSAAAHVILGLVASFVGPIVAAWIMKKSKWLEFFMYPGKFIKIR